MSIFTHIMVGAKNLAASTSFYDAALAPLAVKNLGPLGDKIMMYGKNSPEFMVTMPANGEPATHANGGTLGFAAASRAAVNAFHAAGLASGGTCEGAPGPRPWAPTAYGAYLRDPAGNKICAYTMVAD